MSSHGLPDKAVAKLLSVFAAHPHVEQVILYGSRAKGNYRPGSDIDLTIVGNAVDWQELLRIDNEIDDLLLPYKWDLSLLRQIDNPDLLEHIRRVGVVFYPAG
jgi:predicted nucleotidyltransferase